MSDETELGREKEYIRNILQVNGYPDWMLGDLHGCDQVYPVQEEEEEEEEKGVEQERKEVEQGCQLLPWHQALH